MAKQGKRLKAIYAGFDRDAVVPLVEAITLAKANAKAKFDETIEISMNLGIDPRHADQMVRGVVGLPNGTGKTVRVGVFARGPKRRWPPAPTWSGPTTWPPRCRKARSSSIVVLRLPT